MYYAGKSRTFHCMGDVHYLDDLKKEEHSIIKESQKHLEEVAQQMSSPCRPHSNTNLRGSPIIRL